MHPYILEAVARERIADMHAAAAKYRLKKEAAAARAARGRRASWSIAGWRHHRVELVWPDGVASVVEVPRQSAPANEDRGLAGTRR
jgi:hypothetical protein